ncbi:MAG: DNA-binding protein [Proteobacteria bacterium]|nr:MAG: DNA-binding protein [Pseudomonadota bacterium]
MECPTGVQPTEGDTELARESSHRLAHLLGGLSSRAQSTASGSPVTIQIHLDGEQEVVAIPSEALRMLNEILIQMAAGNAISVLPQKCELTTMQAAQMLNVSRPYLIGLLESEQIPFRKVGTHRRVLLEDLLNYKRGIDEKRLQALQELSELSEELEIG